MASAAGVAGVRATSRITRCSSVIGSGKGWGDHSPKAHEPYSRRYTTVVSVSAGSGVGSPYISHECPADSLRFAAIHSRMASCASFKRLYGPRWMATAASPVGVTVAYTSPAVSNVRVTSTPKSHSIGAPGWVGWWKRKMLWPSVHRPGWLRMNGQTFPRAGPHAAPTVPGGDLAPHRGQLARVNVLYVDGDWHCRSLLESVP